MYLNNNIYKIKYYIQFYKNTKINEYFIFKKKNKNLILFII